MIASIIIAATLLLTLIEKVTGNPFLASWAGRGYARAVGAQRNHPKTTDEYGMRVFVTARDLKGLGFDQTAMTIGQAVIIERDYWTKALEYHEEGHVLQYQRLTSLGFLLVYGFYWLVNLVKHGGDWWENHPLEQEADAHMWARTIKL